jgi:hypothetical protein
MKFLIEAIEQAKVPIFILSGSASLLFCDSVPAEKINKENNEKYLEQKTSNVLKKPEDLQESYSKKRKTIPMDVHCLQVSKYVKEELYYEKRVFETLPLPAMEWLYDQALVHLEVQQQAFSCKIPHVIQFCTPKMGPGAAKDIINPVVDICPKIHFASFSSVASLLMQIVHRTEEFNRKMVGISFKK